MQTLHLFFETELLVFDADGVAPVDDVTCRYELARRPVLEQRVARPPLGGEVGVREERLGRLNVQGLLWKWQN